MNRRGAAAENLAADFLRRHGLRLLEQNYRCRFGEIDLVMREGCTTVFVEVRQRAGSAFGSAAESITGAKRARLLAAARHYIARHGGDAALRFDALLLTGADPPRIEWIKDAIGE
ncbi:MAG TPA: YraN family protein [Burkholderiales bacterium]|nr:YraN family protein [Burkholderiales bacterium]